MAASFAVRLHVLDEAESTNGWVKRAIDEGQPEGLVVRARCQTGGYGRQGRAWVSPRGGLYCSMLLRPQVDAARLSTLGLVAGVAVRRALADAARCGGAREGRAVSLLRSRPEADRRDAGAAAAAAAAGRPPAAASQSAAVFLIKWPNDVVVADGPPACLPTDLHAAGPGASREHAGDAASPASFRKICGISAEARGGAICLGIGVNVFAPSDPVSVGGKNIPVYLEEFPGAIEGLMRFGAHAGESSAARGGLRACGAGVSKDAGGLELYRAGGFAGGGDGAGVRAPSKALGAFDADSCLDALLAKLLDAFLPLYRQWGASGFAPFMDEFADWGALQGRFVTVSDRVGASLAAGRVLGVDADGRLVVLGEDGRRMAICSGEAHLG